MSAKDETLLLRRYWWDGETSFADPGRPEQPTTTQGSDPTGGFPQPPNLNRLVRSVFDARPSFTREFLYTNRATVNASSGGLGAFVSTDLVFDVPSGYLAVWRSWWIELDFDGSPTIGARAYLAVLLNGNPVPDVRGFNNPDAGQNGVLVFDNEFVNETGEIFPYYLEVPPGGTFGLRLLADFNADYPIVMRARVTGSFVRAENVPVELQIASPPQVTPTVPASFRR